MTFIQLYDSHISMQQADFVVEQKLSEIRRQHEAELRKQKQTYSSQEQQLVSNTSPSTTESTLLLTFPRIEEILSPRIPEQTLGSLSDYSPSSSHQSSNQLASSSNAHIAMNAMGYSKRNYQGDFVEHQRNAYAKQTMYKADDAVEWSTIAIQQSIEPVDNESSPVKSAKMKETEVEELKSHAFPIDPITNKDDLSSTTLNVSFKFVKPPATAHVTITYPIN